nr:macro domain-containing protein [Bacillus sp. 1NLA3E]
MAANKNLNSISFPSISTGVYRFPVDLAATIALKTIIAFLDEHQLMVQFWQNDFEVYVNALKNILSEKQKL